MMITSFLVTKDPYDLSRCPGRFEMYPLDGMPMFIDIGIAVSLDQFSSNITIASSGKE
jgi:hypothetical protein